MERRLSSPAFHLTTSARPASSGAILVRLGSNAQEGFTWWIERVQATLEVVDIVRVDHFRGFAACWEIPGGDKTAERGDGSKRREENCLPLSGKRWASCRLSPKTWA